MGVPCHLNPFPPPGFVRPGEVTTHKQKEARHHVWAMGIFILLKSFVLQNRPPGNKIATTID
jgi:hypothetical protein